MEAAASFFQIEDREKSQEVPSVNMNNVCTHPKLRGELALSYLSW